MFAVRLNVQITCTAVRVTCHRDIHLFFGDRESDEDGVYAKRA